MMSTITSSLNDQMFFKRCIGKFGVDLRSFIEEFSVYQYSPPYSQTELLFLYKLSSSLCNESFSTFSSIFKSDVYKSLADWWNVQESQKRYCDTKVDYVEYMN